MKKNILTLLCCITIAANICYGLDVNTKTINEIPFNEAFETDTDVTVNYNIPIGNYMVCATQADLSSSNSYLEYKNQKMIIGNRGRYDPFIVLPSSSPISSIMEIPPGYRQLILTNNQDYFIAHIKPSPGLFGSYTITLICVYKEFSKETTSLIPS